MVHYRLEVTTIPWPCTTCLPKTTLSSIVPCCIHGSCGAYPKPYPGESVKEQHVLRDPTI